MKTTRLNQFEIPSQELVNETIQNYEKELRISELKTLMRKFKEKNVEKYRSLHREYLSLIK